MGRRSKVVVLVAMTCLEAADARAYVDPGSGLLLVQAALSAVVGGLFLARRYLARLTLRVRTSLGRRVEPEPPGPGGSTDRA